MRSCRALGLAGICFGLLVVLLAGPASWAATAKSTAHALTPAPSCPSEDSCVSIAGNASLSGGTLQAGPTHNLGSNQWVYIDSYGFTPNTQLRADLCADVAPLSSQQPFCLNSPTTLILNAAASVTTLADGTETWSYQVGEEDTTSPPLPGALPGTSTTGSFFCDATHQCAIDITNIGVGASNQSDPLTTQNTAVIPISFASNSIGCGSTAASVDTESDFGMELVLPTAAANSCNEASPTIAFNTALDGVGAVTAVANDSAEVGFTDDPEASDQQAVLTQGNYKLIPVALTANVVGYKAQMGQNQLPFPLPSLDLTPNMAAGLLIGTYNAPNAADAITCSKVGGCPAIPCGSTKSKFCSLFSMLNYRPGFSLPTSLAPFVRSDAAGSTGLFLDWLCNAPSDASTTVPVSITPPGGSTYTNTIAETESGATLLETAFGTQGHPLKTCPDFDQYPPAALGAAVQYSAYNDPNQQTLKLVSYVGVSSSGSTQNGGFATMNWAEARYWGLVMAGLQNAAGKFVVPSQASLDAAVSVAKTNPDGTISPDYTSTNADAYPMTSVVYADVCADAVPTQQATDETNLLTQLLQVTGPNANQLPDGFVPLPSSLAQQAQTDIQNDIVGGGQANTVCGPSAGGGGGGSSSSSGGGSSSSGSSSGSGSSGGGSSSGTTGASVTTGSGSGGVAAAKVQVPGAATPKSLTFGYQGLNGARGTGSGANNSGSSSGGTHLLLFTLNPSASRVLLPLALLLGLLAVLVGGFLSFSPGLRERTLAVAGSTKSVFGRGVRRGRSWFSGGLSGTKRRW